MKYELTKARTTIQTVRISSLFHWTVMTMADLRIQTNKPPSHGEQLTCSPPSPILSILTIGCVVLPRSLPQLIVVPILDR